MERKKSTVKALLSFIFFFLIPEMITEECGWAHRIERFLIEPEAMEGSWPWMVKIFKLNSDGIEIESCSGSMISSEHILTAAHFFDHKNPSLYRAKIGNVDERVAQDYNISRIVLSDSYVRGRYYNDIAILTLAKNVDTEDFNPVCLPPKQGFTNLTGEFAAVVGWGSTVSKRLIDSKLKEKFGLLVIPNSRCQKIAQDSDRFDEIFPQGIVNEIICTASPNECIGEAGTPLLLQVEDQWYVVGVKSFGWDCETSDFPTGYTRVTNYLDWIERNVKFACGWSPRADISLRNVTTNHRTWPWMVTIVKRNRLGKFDRLCTGSMISKRHALVAAHCFQRRNPSLYKARIGHVDDRLAQEYNITRIVVHDKYVEGRFYSDIAILTLEKDVASENFNPICLPPNSDFVNLRGRNNAVVGWELSFSSGQKYPKLKENFGVEVVSNSRCNTIYSSMKSFRRTFPQDVGEGMMCAAYPQACSAESGSPLMYEKEDRWFIVGLVSFGTPCNVSPDFPTGFTKVTDYLNWIGENTKN